MQLDTNNGKDEENASSSDLSDLLNREKLVCLWYKRTQDNRQNCHKQRFCLIHLIPSETNIIHSQGKHPH